MSLLPDLEHGDIKNNIENKTKKLAEFDPRVQSVVFIGPEGRAQERYLIGNSNEFVTVPVALDLLENPGVRVKKS